MHNQVTRIGQPIGAVIADNKVHAQRAAKMVKIEYENINPIIVTIEVEFNYFKLRQRYSKIINRLV